MEAWRDIWRRGVVPLLSDRGLESLRRALVDDDPTLLQGQNTRPLALHPDHDAPCAGACVLGYAGWKGEPLETVDDVETFFARMCHEVDCRLGEPAGVRHFLGWFDDTSRHEMRMSLLVEVQRELSRRLGGEGEADTPLEVRHG